MSSEQRRVQDKVVVVTGAGSGIGRATAIRMASEGATVIVTDRDVDKAGLCAREIAEQSGRAQAMQLDVARESEWTSLIDAVLGQHQKLDVLVNNAGVSSAKSVADSTWEEWRNVMAVNLDGVFLGTKHAIAAMRESRGGSIVNVASVSGIKPSAGASAYCASKAAVRLFSKTAAIECADDNSGIRINVVTPGGVKTPMWEQVKFFRDLMDQHGGADEAYDAMAGETPSHQFFSADEVAQTIVYLASNESAHLTGLEIIMDRGHTG